MSTKKRHLLTGMAFDEVSLVDKGANQHAKVVFSKRDDVSKASPSPGDVHSERALGDDDEDEDEVVVVKFRDEDGVMKYGRASTDMNPRPGRVHSTPDTGGTTMGVNPEDLPAEVVDYIQKSESYIDTLEKRVEEQAEQIAKGDGADTDHSEDDDMDDIEKALSSLDDNQRAVFAAIHKRAEDAEAIAKRERELRLDREFSDKADSLDALPVEKSDLTDIFKSLSERAPEAVELVEGILSKANESLKTSAAFEENGSSQGAGSAGDAAVAHITKAAEASALEGVSAEESIVKAMEANPELYDRYLLEQGS